MTSFLISFGVLPLIVTKYTDYAIYILILDSMFYYKSLKNILR